MLARVGKQRRGSYLVGQCLETSSLCNHLVGWIRRGKKMGRNDNDNDLPQITGKSAILIPPTTSPLADRFLIPYSPQDTARNLQPSACGYRRPWHTLANWGHMSNSQHDPKPCISARCLYRSLWRNNSGDASGRDTDAFIADVVRGEQLVR